MTDAQRYARVEATMGREGWRRDALHTATISTLTGRGTSQAKALADLGRLITEACKRDLSDGVKFAYDADNANLWVAVPDIMHDGYRGYAVDCSGQAPAGARLCVNGTGPAREAWTHAVGMAPLADRAAPRALPVMPAEVREMLDKAAGALFALQRYTHQGETETAMRDALSDLADYVSGQFAPSELAR